MDNWWKEANVIECVNETLSAPACKTKLTLPKASKVLCQVHDIRPWPQTPSALSESHGLVKRNLANCLFALVLPFFSFAAVSILLKESEFVIQPLDHALSCARCCQLVGLTPNWGRQKVSKEGNYLTSNDPHPGGDLEEGRWSAQLGRLCRFSLNTWRMPLSLCEYVDSLAWPWELHDETLLHGFRLDMRFRRLWASGWWWPSGGNLLGKPTFGRFAQYSSRHRPCDIDSTQLGWEPLAFYGSPAQRVLEVLQRDRWKKSTHLYRRTGR